MIDPVDRDIRLRPDPNSIRLVPWYPEPTAQVLADCYYHDGSPVEISSRHVLRRVLEALRRQGLGAGRGTRARVLPDQDQRGPRLPAGAADRPLAAAGDGAPVVRHRRGQRVRPDLRGRLRLVRGAGDRRRHADPRGRGGADGDQLQPRQRARARRPGLPVQAHPAPGRPQARHLRHLHGQADDGRARQLDAHPPERDRPQCGPQPVLAGRR